MKRIYVPKKEPKSQVPIAAIAVLTFLLGGWAASSVLLHHMAQSQHPPVASMVPPPPRRIRGTTTVESSTPASNPQRSTAPSVATVLQGQRILVVLVAFDFSQLPHLEEVLDGYHDVCATGASVVDVKILATVAYPVTLIDLWNTRFSCPSFSVSILLKPSSLRLHLVDEHKALFYNSLDQYDLFIYSEDDMRVSPTALATYLWHTQSLQTKVDQPSDYNIGVVRYEYNYPANVIIDDNTRHATQNVTRVYWEHSGFERPVVPNAVVPTNLEGYVSMKNHHQGMYLATQDLLRAWKDRGPNCKFDEARNRPGRGSQPTEGTQRVWMSSQMLYGGRHCNVTQLLPVADFGALTIWHLPNKNYRRVGKYRNRKFADGSEVFEQPHASLLTAMELHLAVPKEPQLPYRGVTMVDEVNKARDRTPLLERRMQEYTDYVKRGGVLSDYDRTKTVLVEES